MENIAAQMAIRREAEQNQDAIAEMAAWSQEISKKDAALLAASSRAAAARAAASAPPSALSAAGHTYDKGYRKWDAFDPDAEPARGVAPSASATAQASPAPPGVRASTQHVVSFNRASAAPRSEASEREAGYVGAARGLARAGWSRGRVWARVGEGGKTGCRPLTQTGAPRIQECGLSRRQI